MKAAGIAGPDSIVADGALHRFHVNGDHSGSLNGWYILHEDDPPAGAFGCWKRGISETWSSKPDHSLSPAEKAAQGAKFKAARAERERLQEEIHAETRRRAAEIWKMAEPAPATHPYLTKKGIAPYGVRVSWGSLVIPLRDSAGTLQGLQFIDQDGGKKYLTGTRKTGAYFAIGGKPAGVLYLCEGFATGASIHQATGGAVAVAFDAGNLRSVAEALRQKFPGLRIVVCADNDTWTDGNPGATKAREAAEAVEGLLALPIFRNTAERPTDFNDLHCLEGPDEVRRQIEAATPASGQVEIPPSAHIWEEPSLLPDDLPSVPAFDTVLLPEAFRPWIQDVAERMQCPVEYPAVGAMVALASVVGRQVGIRPKRHDDWQVVPNLWGAIIGGPARLKTPSLSEVMKPLHQLEAKAREQFEMDLKVFDAECLVEKATAEETKKAIASAIRRGDRDEGKRLALAVTADKEEKPARRRYITNDASVEKLGELLAATPRGILSFRDELTGWLRGLEREGQEAARAFYLEAWNGTGRFTYDRIGRGTVEIEACCVSVLGGIQPGPLMEYVRGALAGSAGDDGLLQRLQLIVWPDAPANWRNVDRRPDSEARDKAWQVFESLNCLTPEACGAAQECGGIPFLRFNEPAQQVFDDWRARLENRLGLDLEHPAFEAHLAKYRSLIPSLALLIHLADGGCGPVNEAAALAAIAWGEYLEEHARRLYAPALDPATAAARELVRRIQRKDLQGPFVARDVYRRGWRLLDRRGTEEALNLLEELGHLRAENTEPKKAGGRPKVIWHIHPNLQR
jgi:putative DNA primase/helicase